MFVFRLGPYPVYLALLYVVIVTMLAGKSFYLPQYVMFCVIMLVPLSCVQIFPGALCSGIFHSEISSHMKI
jgi:hypothetical protein